MRVCTWIRDLTCREPTPPSLCAEAVPLLRVSGVIILRGVVCAAGSFEQKWFIMQALPVMVALVYVVPWLFLHTIGRCVVDNMAFWSDRLASNLGAAFTGLYLLYFGMCAWKRTLLSLVLVVRATMNCGTLALGLTVVLFYCCCLSSSLCRLALSWCATVL